MINKIKKVHMFRIEKNSDLLKSVNNFISTNKIQTGFISGIGAVKKLKIAYFENKKYNTIERDIRSRIVQRQYCYERRKAICAYAYGLSR